MLLFLSLRGTVDNRTGGIGAWTAMVSVQLFMPDLEGWECCENYAKHETSSLHENRSEI